MTVVVDPPGGLIAMILIGTAFVLSADEARHVQARRLRVGDVLTAFDGAGRVAALGRGNGDSMQTFVAAGFATPAAGRGGRAAAGGAAADAGTTGRSPLLS